LHANLQAACRAQEPRFPATASARWTFETPLRSTLRKPPKPFTIAAESLQYQAMIARIHKAHTTAAIRIRWHSQPMRPRSAACGERIGLSLAVGDSALMIE
jgi:hypothetical protein